MRVLYDYQIFTMQNHGGISRYFIELISNLEKQKEIEVQLGFKFSNNTYIKEKEIKGVFPFFSSYNFKGKDQLYNYLNQNFSKYKILSGDYEVLHPTYYDPYFLKNNQNKKYVITCYDMIHEIYSEKYPDLINNNPLILKNKKEIITGAAKVIAISKQTKADIMKFYNIDEKNIEVIHLGNSLIPNSNANEAIVKEPYLLFVGNRSLYKNFSGLLDGLQEILKINKIKLICAGGGVFKPDEIELIKNYGLEDYVFNVSFDNDLMLSNLYTHAILFLFPSLYEGFGIPVLEAFACKCPIAMSKGGSLMEVGGNAASYFQPEDPSSIHDVVSSLVSNSDYRNELISRGTKQLKQFSWELTCDKTMSLYKSLT